MSSGYQWSPISGAWAFERAHGPMYETGLICQCVHHPPTYELQLWLRLEVGFPAASGPRR